MTRQDLINVLAQEADIKKVQADAALRAFEQAVTTELKKGRNVAIVGFGTFKVRKRKARTAINPQNPTGPKIKVAAKTVPAFTAGKKLKEAVAGKK